MVVHYAYLECVCRVWYDHICVLRYDVSWYDEIKWWVEVCLIMWGVMICICICIHMWWDSMNSLKAVKPWRFLYLEDFV